MIDNKLTRMLRADIADAIQDIGKEYGVVLEVRPGSYSTNNFTLKIEGSQMVGDEVMTREAVAYRTYSMHEQTGLELFSEFTDGGETFKVTGYRTRASKRPILCRSLKSGRDYGFPTQMVKRLGGVVN